MITQFLDNHSITYHEVIAFIFCFDKICCFYVDRRELQPKSFLSKNEICFVSALLEEPKIIYNITL